MAIVSRVSFAAVYKVGDDAGWSIPNAQSVNYNAWAEAIDFHVGDILSFEYNSLFHSVLEVSREDYESCNTQSPMKSYTTGKDSITLESSDPRYFICGAPGHCQMGMKLEISTNGAGNSPNVPTRPMLQLSPYSSPGWNPWLESSAWQLQLATKLVIAVAALAIFSIGFIY
ncbi:Phytocyanin domain-containing protein [Citrus sinensis]|nr:Phytocyanin domain-containing protein [Citrus sinensis]